MTISENTMNLYRSSTDINQLIMVLVDSYLSSLVTKVGKKESLIIEKLLTIETDIAPQIMKIFESPLNNTHFKDLVNQLMIPLVNERIEEAHLRGIITAQEAELMIIVLSSAI